MKQHLPIDDILGALADAFQKNSALVLSAAPGAGKTTRVPVEVAKYCDKQVWVLEPRRIAAVSAAQRIAEENDWTLGKEVGYQVRFENRSTSSTKILFLTEALLLRKLLVDPELSQVSCVVLDEFHERSLHVDMALAALKELQELSRPDLKIVVMSATLNASPLAQYLNRAPVIEAPGKIFPLDIRYDDKPQLLQTGPDFIERLKKAVLKTLNENPQGDILCFLPGRGEIERVRTALENSQLAKNIFLHTLHGQLSLQEQKEAILPNASGRKIILTTNIAESSLTVQGVRLVVDSGLARLQKQDSRTGFESLQLVRISKASATQRAGRAARLGPGIVYRVWSLHDERAMTAFETAEVLRVDLSEAVLLLAALGVPSPDSFSWFEKPQARALQMAFEFLKLLGAISSDGALTALGQKLRDFPVHPRIAKLLIVGKEKQIPVFAAELGALLSEAKTGRSEEASGRENDVMANWENWKQRSSHPRFKMLNRAAEQLKELIGGAQSTRPMTEDLMEELLLDVYSDRLCRRRRAQSPEAKMVGGRGVKIHNDSSVKESEFFLAIELAEGRDSAHAIVFQAVGLHPELVQSKILPKAKPQIRVEWDEESQKFWSVETLEWNGLSVGLEKRRPAQTTEVQEQLVDVALERWSWLLQKNETLGNWFSRLQFLNSQNADWPLLEEADLREALVLACYGENSLATLATKDLITYFENRLSDAHRSALQKECPSHWQVPTGNRMRIDYIDGQGPQIEVRLQEMFGLEQTPNIAGMPLTLVLLAPNYRPVQVTRDLASFWKNGYPEVRKEMRARYPKHSWPDDPLSAPPQSKGRPHNKR